MQVRILSSYHGHTGPLVEMWIDECKQVKYMLLIVCLGITITISLTAAWAMSLNSVSGELY